ncbi:MAG: TetR/AcrR family transcriptional regulator [Actinobacteria bacterium]|nr:TetR/AcrR family transcriptional regulator [Actinomycetota bacterium]
MARAPVGGPPIKELSARERELLRATIEVLEEYGYDRLTIDEVAARAHASKATIYRRWPSKATLIIAATAARMDTAAFGETMEEASLRDELLHLVGLLAAEAKELRATVAALLGGAGRDEQLRKSIEEHFVTPRRDAIRALLDRRRVAGDVRAGVDIDLVGAIPSAFVYQRLLLTFEPVDDALPERIVDEVMLPLLT